MDHTDTSADTAVAIACVLAMPRADLAELRTLVHPAATNREAVAEPPAARGTGPEALHASALWLRSAFDDLAFEVHEVVAAGDLVVLHTTMSGTHARPFVVHADDGGVRRAFAPTGRTFSVTQTHWLRMRDHLVVEHWADRDDQGMAEQAGWVPPSPRYLVRCALATARARRLTDSRGEVQRPPDDGAASTR